MQTNKQMQMKTASIRIFAWLRIGVETSNDNNNSITSKWVKLDATTCKLYRHYVEIKWTFFFFFVSITVVGDGGN